MEKKLVSIVTPCYNGEKYLDRFFHNILDQTYEKLELIFINDGSTDKTEEIACSYADEFEKQGRKLIYIYQENAGQAAACNKGFAIFNGDYLVWTDADDLLDKDNIQKKVDFLETNPNMAFVMCRGREVMANDINKKIGDLKRVRPSGIDNMFYDFIVEKNVVFTPGVYMVRREAFLQAIPARHIYESRAGQNWQVLLPLCYKYKYGYIEEELFSYVIYEDSHSRADKTIESVYAKLQSHDDILRTVLTEMGLKDSEYYRMLDDKLIRKQFDNAYFYKDKVLLKEKYRLLKQRKSASKRDTLIYLAGRNEIIDRMYSVFKKVKNKRRAKM